MFVPKIIKSVPLLLGLWVCGVGQEFHEGNWNYKATLTLNTSFSGANVSNSVQSIPILIRLNASNFSFENSKESGEDLRFVKMESHYLMK